jgi:hypothetical protein
LGREVGATRREKESIEPRIVIKHAQAIGADINGAILFGGFFEAVFEVGAANFRKAVADDNRAFSPAWH